MQDDVDHPWHGEDIAIVSCLLRQTPKTLPLFHVFCDGRLSTGMMCCGSVG